MGATSARERFLETYELSADSVFRLCYAKTGNREAALDLVQETFMKVWDYIAAGNEIQHMQAFVFAVARNLIKDYYKKQRPLYEHEMTEALPDAPDTAQTPAEYAEAMRLMVLTQRLNDKHREVLLLRYVEGMGAKEIAELLGERENTVSVRINRALKELRKLFDGA